MSKDAGVDSIYLLHALLNSMAMIILSNYTSWDILDFITLSPLSENTSAVTRFCRKYIGDFRYPKQLVVIHTIRDNRFFQNTHIKVLRDDW